MGTVFGIITLNDKSNFNSNPTTQTANSGENHALIADMSFGVAVTLGVTSAVLFFTADDNPPPPPVAAAHPARRDASTKGRSGFTITPSPLVLAHGGGAAALIRF